MRLTCARTRWTRGGAGEAQARQVKAHLRDRPDRLRLLLARHRVVGFATCRADKTRIVFEIGPDRTRGVFIPSGSGDIGHPAVGCAGAVIAVGHPHLFEGGRWWRGAREGGLAWLAAAQFRLPLPAGQRRKWCRPTLRVPTRRWLTGAWENSLSRARARREAATRVTTGNKEGISISGYIAQHTV